MPPIDPDSMPSAEPPRTPEEYAIGDYVGETLIYGHTIHEHQNAWVVMRRKPNGAVISQRVLHKREGYTRSDAIALAGRQDMEKHNGGS